MCIYNVGVMDQLWLKSQVPWCAYPKTSTIHNCVKLRCDKTALNN
uniref:Uncharacterized protein n=1 Tax=Ciona intestinalis TaxID=7719 RepID=H2XKB4_CIOIN